ncbi:MAG TPA: ferrous iron transporter B, partial [Rhizobiales bacterium]|nr:ferrous iron transporter B [Hyphomicrobiales bacterium]
MTCAKCPSEAVQPGKGDITAALAGNPNCGKTTLFNNLTGAHQRVGNWPGVTVDRKEGRYRDDEGEISIIDLPGVYTLGVVPGAEGESLDETLARDFIVSGGADVLINVVNAANLERNLYLTAQLTEMHVPMLVVLNMMDAASNAGLEVDPQALSERLGVPVIAMSAVKNNRTADLVKAIRTLAHSGQRPAARPHYRPEVEALIGGIADGFAARPEIMDGIAADPRWLAVRLVEGDDLACRLVGADQCAALADRISALEAECGEDADI